MTDEIRARYLRDRVLTATPAQRVVMLYDRLGLDLTLAQTSTGDGDSYRAGGHLSHALQVVAELQASLDLSAGGPADNLAGIYGYLLQELLAARGGATERLGPVVRIVSTLRDAWAAAVEQLAVEPRQLAVGAGSWTG